MTRSPSPSSVLLLVGAALGSACGRADPQAGAAPSASAIAAKVTFSAPPPAASVPVIARSPALVQRERLKWDAPPGWRNLGVPFQGVSEAHYQAAVDMTPKPPEEAAVFIVRHGGARGDTPDARVADAILHEADAFTQVDFKRTLSRVVDGRKVQIVEIHGAMHERVVLQNGDEDVLVRPHRTEITAMVPTQTAPYRVALHGRDDLVDRVREDFFRLVDSLRVVGE